MKTRQKDTRLNIHSLPGSENIAHTALQQQLEVLSQLTACRTVFIRPACAFSLPVGYVNEQHEET